MVAEYTRKNFSRLRQLEAESIASQNIPEEPYLAWRYGIQPEHVDEIKSHLQYCAARARSLNEKPTFAFTASVMAGFVAGMYIGSKTRSPFAAMMVIMCTAYTGRNLEYFIKRRRYHRAVEESRQRILEKIPYEMNGILEVE